jgi:hypothetical protein
LSQDSAACQGPKLGFIVKCPNESVSERSARKKIPIETDRFWPFCF